MLFWIAAIVISVAVAATLVLTVLRAHPEEVGGAEDVQIYRDQLREVERDLARGLLVEGDAERLRLEISRRILDADRGKTRQMVSTPAPRGAVIGAAAAVVVLTAGSFWLYTQIGQPGFEDQPLAARHAASRAELDNLPTQAALEAEFGQQPVETGVGAPSDGEADAPQADPEAQPDGAAGEADTDAMRQSVAEAVSRGDFSGAHAAQARLVAVLGANAQGHDHAVHAQLMIWAAGGQVSDEARIALERALQLDPSNPWARYLSGVLMYQIGRADRTFADWNRLLTAGPPDAPWVQLIRLDIEAVAARAGISNFQLPPAAPSGPGVSGSAEIEDQLGALDDMSPEEVDAMIRNMVDQLSARLANQGGPADEWAFLIQALAVLEEQDRAAEILAEAQVVFGADREALDLILRTAQEFGVAP